MAGMDYALAKELKEAGFPQAQSEVIANPENAAEVAAVPGLAALHAACSEELRALAQGAGPFFAIGRGIVGEGATEAEALARLWLAASNRACPACGAARPEPAAGG